MEKVKNIALSILALYVVTIITMQVVSNAGLVDYVEVPFLVFKLVLFSALLWNYKNLSLAIKSGFSHFLGTLVGQEDLNYEFSNKGNKLITGFAALVWLYLLVRIIYIFL